MLGQNFEFHQFLTNTDLTCCFAVVKNWYSAVLRYSGNPCGHTGHIVRILLAKPPNNSLRIAETTQKRSQQHACSSPPARPGDPGNGPDVGPAGMSAAELVVSAVLAYASGLHAGWLTTRSHHQRREQHREDQLDRRALRAAIHLSTYDGHHGGRPHRPYP
jgi:hypothetical protein